MVTKFKKVMSDFGVVKSVFITITAGVILSFMGWLASGNLKANETHSLAKATSAAVKRIEARNTQRDEERVDLALRLNDIDNALEINNYYLRELAKKNGITPPPTRSRSRAGP
jgi:hypothetical protein